MSGLQKSAKEKENVVNPVCSLVSHPMDPVCGMTVNFDTPHRITRQGNEYFFCSPQCLERFKEAAEHCLKSGQAEPVMPSLPQAESAAGACFTCPMPPGVEEQRPGDCPAGDLAREAGAPSGPLIKIEWICLMHPKMAQDTPGDCPMCGMTLEARPFILEEKVADPT